MTLYDRVRSLMFADATQHGSSLIMRRPHLFNSTSSSSRQRRRFVVRRQLLRLLFGTDVNDRFGFCTRPRPVSVVDVSIMCDPIQPNPSADRPNPTQSIGQSNPWTTLRPAIFIISDHVIVIVITPTVVVITRPAILYTTGWPA